MGSTGATSFISRIIINIAKSIDKYDAITFSTVPLMVVGFANGASKSGLKDKETEERIKEQNIDYENRHQLHISRKNKFKAKVEKMRSLGDDVGSVLTFIEAFPDS